MLVEFVETLGIQVPTQILRYPGTGIRQKASCLVHAVQTVLVLRVKGFPTVCSGGTVFVCPFWVHQYPGYRGSRGTS
eukprot:3689999-Rhodomonas_salina.2